MLVARFSDDIKADIQRGFSCWMHPGLGSTREECERDAEELGLHVDIRPLPGGGFGIAHHDGLSCYKLEASDVAGAIDEVRGNAGVDGSGYGQATVGAIKLLRTVSAGEIGSIRDLHILQCEDVQNEL